MFLELLLGKMAVRKNFDCFIALSKYQDQLNTFHAIPSGNQGVIDSP
jgi:hypothetical protein